MVSIIVKEVGNIGLSWPSIVILYGPKKYIDNLSQGVASASFVGKLPQLLSWFFFLTYFANLNMDT